jgi:hypothetical protein
MGDESDDAWAQEIFREHGRGDRSPAQRDADATLRERLLESTIVEVSRRRRRWIVRRSCAAFLIFLLGGVVGGGVMDHLRSRHPTSETSASSDAKSVVDPIGEIPPRMSESSDEIDDPAMLEVRAAEAKIADRARFLRRAADLYLEESTDIAAASRCYGEYLRLIDRSSLERDRSSETWLLTSMRSATN